MRTTEPSRKGAAAGTSTSGLGNDAFSASSAAGFAGVKATRCSLSSKIRNTAVEKPPMRRFELPAMASNTGCTSDGELAITFRISAVAVCRSSASLVSRNSRTFRIAITAWSAKVCSNSICGSVRAPGCGDDIEITPIATPSRIKGAEAIERNDNSRVCDLKKMSLPGARLSATWTARPSTTARPDTLCRSIGTTSGP